MEGQRGPPRTHTVPVISGTAAQQVVLNAPSTEHLNSLGANAATYCVAFCVSGHTRRACPYAQFALPTLMCFLKYTFAEKFKKIKKRQKMSENAENR